MNGRICLSPQQAFEAGFEEPCQHTVRDPDDCPECRLSTDEIRRLAVLLRRTAADENSAAAA